MSDAQLELAAEILGPLVQDVAFVGGATIHLWLTEPGAPPTRATDDVDVICDVHSRGDYYVFADRLRDRRLHEALNEPVVCRWRHAGTGLAIDVMPLDADVLGFTNPWYELGMATAVAVTLDSGATIRAVDPPLVIATKIAAWRGRGGGDILHSNDVHDILVLINGRPEIVGELALQTGPVRDYVYRGLVELAGHEFFPYAIRDAVHGYGQLATERAEILSNRIDEIRAALKSEN